MALDSRRLTLAFIQCALIGVLTACNTSVLSKGENSITTPEGPLAPPTTLPSEPLPPPLDFATIQKRIFEPSCVRCHRGRGAGGVELETFDQVIQFLPEIKATMELNTMPPRGKISQESRELVIRWINEGARQE
jgi:hypothetical protein